MRLSWKRLAVLLTMAAIALPVLAQFFPGGFGGAPNVATLLTNTGVIAELKITDEQKADFKKITDKAAGEFKEEIDKARADKDFKGMFAATKKSRDAQAEAVTKAMGTILKPDQVKRLKQIELQVLGMAALTKDTVIKDLKLTDDQVTKIKGLDEDYKKDRAEMFKDAFKEKDKDKRTEAFKKAAEMQVTVFDKATGVLTDSQKKHWKEMIGEKFDYKADKGGFKGGKGKGKGKGA